MACPWHESHCMTRRVTYIYIKNPLFTITTHLCSFISKTCVAHIMTHIIFYMCLIWLVRPSQMLAQLHTRFDVLQHVGVCHYIMLHEFQNKRIYYLFKKTKKNHVITKHGKQQIFFKAADTPTRLLLPPPFPPFYLLH